MEEIGKDTYKLSDTEILEKKGKEWRIIYPLKKDLSKPFQSDNIQWFNLITGGSIKRLLNLGLILIVIFFVMWSYNNDIQECKVLIEEQNLIYGDFNSDIPIIEYEELEYSIFVPTKDSSS